MRSYEQHCGLAKALDVVGDRWTMLILRELMIRGACRYTDLKYGLPGIATNLLAGRLRELEERGVVAREAAARPIASTLFRLTPRGEELVPALEALGRWGKPLLDESAETVTFLPHWLVLPLRMLLSGRVPNGPPVTIEIRAGDEPITIVTADGQASVHLDSTMSPDVIVTGSPRVVIDLMSGDIDLDAARTKGLEIAGDIKALYRVLSEAKAAPA